MNIATDCTNDIKAKVALTPEVANNVFRVHDPDSLHQIAKKITPPLVGIVYEGIYSKGGAGDKSLSTSLRVGVLLLSGEKALDAVTQNDEGQHTALLDSFREAIKRTISPTGHKWEFVSEVPLDLKERGMVYYQRWQASTQIT